jgi:hypothetical protein
MQAGLENNLSLVLALDDDEYAMLVGRQLIAHEATHDIVHLDGSVELDIFHSR